MMNDEKEGKPHDLRVRLKAYALNVVGLYVRLPQSGEAQILGRQALRSGTSVGAHHREAYRARSNAEFISKMETALQELDETDYWLDLMLAAKVGPQPSTEELIRETNELIAIFTASVKTAKRRR